MPNLIFLTGPTAVGKSAVALELATGWGAEIVSADSMQVYRGLDIGTAKATAAERRAVRQHLLDVCDPGATFDVRQYTDLATNAIRSIHQRGKVALVVGGTGLYLRALRQGLFSGPQRDPALRAKLELLSTATLFAELQRLDPATAATIDRSNPRRLVRALEVYYATGKPIRELQREWRPDPSGVGYASRVSPSAVGHPSRVSRDSSEDTRDAYPTAPLFCLTRARDDLYARIEQRIDAQLAAGWLAEVQALLAGADGRAVTPAATCWQAAGYRELAAHLRGELALAEAVAQTKSRTRQLARRQLTWFRREAGLVWIEIARAEPPATTAARIRKLLEGSAQVTA